MTSDPRLRVSIASARYLEAVECGDQATLATLWELAGSDPELLAAFCEINEGLVEEHVHSTKATVAGELPGLVDRYLTSGEMIQPSTGPVTVADVADELHRNTPDRLPAPAHALNEALRAIREPLPEDLRLSKLVAWASKFGSAPEAYWTAFREAAIKLELRQAADVEYQLAARSAAPKSEGRR